MRLPFKVRGVPTRGLHKVQGVAFGIKNFDVSMWAFIGLCKMYCLSGL